MYLSFCGPQQGFILGSFYDETQKPPSNTVNKRVIRFNNGTRIEIDRESNLLLVDAVGDVTIKATGTVTIDAPETIITGNATVEGLLTFKGGMKGSSAGGVAATISGNVKVVGGDIDVDGIKSKGHHHTAQGNTLRQRRLRHDCGYAWYNAFCCLINSGEYVQQF